jgi:hypothetical protein
MIAAAEVGHGRISSVIEENLPNVATCDLKWSPLGFLNAFVG